MPPTFLLTRPKRLARRFSEELAGFCDKVVISPVLKIRPVAPDCEIDGAALLILTSQYGVERAAQITDLTGREGYAVGQATAQACRDAGMCIVGTGRDAASLVERILIDRPAGKLLYLRGAHVAGNVAEALNSEGIETESVVVYDQVEQPLNEAALQALNGDDPVIIPLFSPRSAVILGEQIGKAGAAAPLHLVAISDAADQAWKGPEPASRCHAAEPRADAMIEEIRRLTAITG